MGQGLVLAQEQTGSVDGIAQLPETEHVLYDENTPEEEDITPIYEIWVQELKKADIENLGFVAAAECILLYQFMEELRKVGDGSDRALEKLVHDYAMSGDKKDFKVLHRYVKEKIKEHSAPVFQSYILNEIIQYIQEGEKYGNLRLPTTLRAALRYQIRFIHEQTRKAAKDNPSLKEFWDKIRGYIKKDLHDMALIVFSEDSLKSSSHFTVSKYKPLFLNRSIKQSLDSFRALRVTVDKSGHFSVKN